VKTLKNDIEKERNVKNKAIEILKNLKNKKMEDIDNFLRDLNSN